LAGFFFFFMVTQKGFLAGFLNCDPPDLWDSWVARITGVSHWCPAWIVVFMAKTETKSRHRQ
jgi:hypothetical protein